MPKYRITSPDGKAYEITAPEGATQEQLIAYAKENAPEPSFADKTKRVIGLTERALLEGYGDIAAPFANPIAAGFNKLSETFGSNFRFPEQSQALSQVLTDIGLPKPSGPDEKAANTIGRIVTSAFGGSPVYDAASGLAPKAPPGFKPSVAQTPAAKTLEANQVPLDKSQSTGSKSLARLRAAVNDHPMTTGKQQAFSETQQKAFNRAVLRSIGADSDEASQSVMSAARSKIGNTFNKVGSGGVAVDDTLIDDLAKIIDDANREIPQHEIAPLLRNIDDILKGVDDAGNIDGKLFIRLRSNLSNLSRRPGVGDKAHAAHEALIDALERYRPSDVKLLSEARDQWRSLRIIQGAVSKDTGGNISPLRLSNAIATKANQNMSVYGIGGDQQLVGLAKAGREVLPESLPNSGTIPRGMMHAPLGAIATAPIYKGAQAYLLHHPGHTNALRYALPAGGGMANRIANEP